ncbi:MAG: glycosyltransferase [Planctomycetota bacterium]
MRVLQFVADGAPGGGTNHVLQICRGLRKTAEVTLLTQQDSYLQREASELGIEVVTGDFFRSRVDRAAIKLVEQTIEQCRPDLIHCHGGRAAFFCSRVRDTPPTAYTVHGFHFARKPCAARLAGWAGEFWSIRRSDQIIFVSGYDRQLAQRYRLLPRKKPYRVIHNGIPKPEIADTHNNKATRGIGFVGRMVVQKNPQLFVEVVRRLPQDIKAVMVGGGELEDEVTKLVKSSGLEGRIELAGGLAHDEALHVLSQLDVLVMTPRWEGLPLLPLEAMHLNVPVVSTSCGGIPEIIEHRVTGMLAKAEDADELATHVQSLLADEKLRSRIISNAHRQVCERFAESTMLRCTQDVYDGMLHRAQAADTVIRTGVNRETGWLDRLVAPFRRTRQLNG